MCNTPPSPNIGSMYFFTGVGNLMAVRHCELWNLNGRASRRMKNLVGYGNPRFQTRTLFYVQSPIIVFFVLPMLSTYTH